MDVCSKVCYLIKGEKPFAEKATSVRYYFNPPILKLLSVCWAPAQWIERSRIEASRTVQESSWKTRVVETPQNQHGRAREVRHADRTRTDVRGPKHPGLKNIHILNLVNARTSEMSWKVPEPSVT